MTTSSYKMSCCNESKSLSTNGSENWRSEVAEGPERGGNAIDWCRERKKFFFI